jgi:hypothetical protein
MNSGMNESARRQILGDLAIEVWLPRTVLAQERRLPAAKPAIAKPPRAKQSPAPRRPSVTPHSQLTVHSMTVPGVLLAVSGTPSRRDLRLAFDLLAAAGGTWQVTPQRREFRWPPAVPAPASDEGDSAANRALAAFLDKDIADHGVDLLLCTTDVVERVPAFLPGCRRQVIPALDELGRDAAAKRALWRFICEARR